MSKRAKIRFDLNYEVLKYKTISEEKKNEVYQKVNSFSEVIEISERNEYYIKETSNTLIEEENPTLIDYYILSFINQNAKRYSKFNIYLEDCINEKYLEDISSIELLIKVLSLKYEANSFYDKSDYIKYQLPKIIELENNELFSSIFNLLHNTLNTNKDNLEKEFNQLCEEYRTKNIKHYKKQFDLIERFAINLYSENTTIKEIKQRKIYSTLEEYSIDEFEELLDYYIFKIKTSALLEVEEDIREEKNPFIKKLFERYIMCITQIVFLEIEYKDLINQFKKKISIIKYALIIYLSKMSEIDLKESRFYYEEKLKMLFDAEIRRELFECIKGKLNG